MIKFMNDVHPVTSKAKVLYADCGSSTTALIFPKFGWE